MKLNSKGFTLIELMIVVSIIGVLATIGSFEYRRMISRSRQVEAKMALSNMYTAEKAFYVEKSSFTHCLRQIGYGMDSGERYYLTGFWDTDQFKCGPNGNQTCYAYDWSGPTPSMCDCDCSTFATGINDANYQATRRVNLTTPSVPYSCDTGDAIGIPFTWKALQSTFIVGAWGNISKDPVYDAWQIDEKKQLINIQPRL